MAKIHRLFLATKVHKAGGTRNLRRPFGPSFGALIGAPGLPSQKSLPKKQEFDR